MNDNKQEHPAPETPKRPAAGFYLLPNFFTTASLFAGFYAVLAAAQMKYEAASYAILLALVLDGFDGRVARLTGTQSEFGAEYDSLSDMVAFGIAPALFAYHWVLAGVGKIGWLAAFIFAAATALRLARFNTKIETADKSFFQGLPCPTAAAIVASGIWAVQDHDLYPGDFAWVTAIIVTLLGLLMVSNFKYYSFKQLNLNERVPFLIVVAIMLGFAVVYSNPPILLFLITSCYALSGPIYTFYLWFSKRRQARHSR